MSTQDEFKSNELNNTMINLNGLVAGQDYKQGEVVIKVKPNLLSSEMQAFQADLGASVLESTQTLGTQLWEIQGMSVADAVATYSNHPQIECIQPNYIYSVDAIIPNDPDFEQLWGLDNTGQTGGTFDADIDAPEAWDISTGNDVVVGVIDTGVDYTHPDLDDNMWTNPGEIPDNGLDDDGNGFVDDYYGWDFANNDNDPFDDDGHGTHVAGTIAAKQNNGIGVTGVAPDAQIMALKFLDADGFGSTFDAIQAVEYATMMGADLTNNSWGGGGFDPALYDAIAAAGEAGQLFIAAAGNGGFDGIGDNNDLTPNYPSNYDLDNIISVAATDHNDNLASFSNYGATSVDLAAPGVGILSTVPYGNGYDTYNGTSMATPHVAGVAALLWSQEPELTALEVKERILNYTDPVSALQGKTVTGGRLNAHNSLTETEPPPPPPGEIYGSKWNDLDGDGVWDTNEPGLAGWTIYLDQNKNGQLDSGELSTITDTNGDYSFTELEADTYTVAEVLLPGWEQTFPSTENGGVARLFGVDSVTSEIVEFDPTNGVELNRFAMPESSSLGPDALAFDGTSLYFGAGSAFGGGSILYELNPDTGAVLDSDTFASIGLSNAIDGLGFINGQIVASDTTTSEVFFVNPVSDTVVSSFFAPVSIRGGLAGAGSRGTLFANDFFTDQIFEFDATTGSLVNTLADPLDDTSGLAFLNGSLYLGDSNTGTVAQIDPDTGLVLDTFATPTSLTALGGDDVDGSSLLPGTHTVNLNPSEIITDINFGNHFIEGETGTISGSKWNDLDGDGVWDTNESGLEGWTIYLDQNNNGQLDSGELSTITDTNGDYSFTGLEAGTYTVSEVLLPGWEQTFPGTDDEEPVSEFQIDVIFTDDSLTVSQQAIFAQAAERWSEIIIGDVPDVLIDDFGLVDDLAITASALDIDGPGGILGQAGPTVLRNDSFLPAFGLMEFDTADLADLEATGQLQDVILHEMGHVLGFGTIWQELGLVDDVGTADPQFLGAAATAEYNDIFGLTASSVPVANTGGPGTADAHWRESVFDNELMTGFFNFGTSNPLSRITAASLSDLGYQVNLAAADVYEPPSPDFVASPKDKVGKLVVLDANKTFVDPIQNQQSENFFPESSAIGTHTVDLSPGEIVTDLNFGNHFIEGETGTISGSKWNDLDGDGVWDTNESGLAGWTIYLDQNNNGQLDSGELSTITDTNGDYSFTGLEADTYTVSEVLLPGWEQTFPGTNSQIGEVLTFDDIADIDSSAPIPQGYGGFDWSSSWRYNNGAKANPQSGYYQGRVSGDYVAFNAFKNPVEVSNSSLFDFNAAYLTAAWNNDLNIQVEGFVDGVQTYSQTVIVDNDSPTFFEFNFLDIDQLKFTSFGGTDADPNNGSGTHFVLDNFIFNAEMSDAPGTHIVNLDPGEIVTDIDFGNQLIDVPPQLNVSFETGDFTDWTTIGTASIQTADFGSNPTDGEFQALLTNGFGSVSDTEIETFLALNPGDLDNLGNGDATEGSAIQLTPITVNAGDTLSFDWNFITNEETPSDYNDFGFISISSNLFSELADTNNEFVRFGGSFGKETNYGTFDYQFTQAGTYTIGLGVVDADDPNVDSGLLVDNFNFVPDPFFNFGFENGDFTNWNTIGDANIETDSIGSSPTEGEFQALITTGQGSMSDTEIEGFFGLSAGDLDDLGNGDATEGSALQFQPLTVEAGDILRFDWNFITNETLPSDYNDFGFVSISSNLLGELADTNSEFVRFTGSFGSQTDYGTFEYQFTEAGTFNVGVGVMDAGDTSVDSGLFVDHFEIVQEPSNTSFETGDFTDWDTIGQASIETANFGSNPTDGDYQALITNEIGSVSEAQLETFLGLNSGALDSLGNGDATEGSALQFKPITVASGDVVSFDWNFLTDEITPSGFNDFAFVSISSDSLSELADTNSSFIPFTNSFNEQTGYGTFSYQFQEAGTYTIAMGVVDVEDTGVDSGLLVDNFSVTSSNDLDGGTFDPDRNPANTSSEDNLKLHKIQGSSQSETLVGSNQKDELIFADAGNDTVAGGLGDDVIHGEAGDDILRGDLNKRSSGGILGGDDIIYGGTGNDRIGGKGGNDQLYGEEGDDKIWGDKGDDLLWGGRGNDTLKGGQGVDTFVLAVGEGTDKIRDFQIVEDFIGLSGELTFEQLSITQHGKNTWIDGNDETLAILTGVSASTLTADVFTLV